MEAEEKEAIGVKGCEILRLLDGIHCREDLLNIKPDQEAQLCAEIRDFLIENVSKTGGHVSSNLGIVELSVAIEKVFDTQKDRLVFDVGHQSYVHKILTGRKDEFSTLRSYGGIAGFPKPSESDADAFVAGHASSAVSTALGMARARRLRGEDYHVIALLGDGAMTGGLAYEGLNDAGGSEEPLIVILNDNGMSITPNVGGIASHLNMIRARPGYFKMKKYWRSFTRSIPGGGKIYRCVHTAKEWLKKKLLGMNLFEEMGFLYMGPVDGHDITRLIYLLKRAKEAGRPVLVHAITQKGKGYEPAERNPDVFHGIGRFDPKTGLTPRQDKPGFSQVFGDTLTDLALRDSRVCAITAAMRSGTGLTSFSQAVPERFFDVGIAEGHAVSMAGGLAKQGMIPVVAIYSTFLQRAFDMIVQDVAMLNLHVVFAVDRAGLVGEDGETHHGILDVGYLRQIPNMQVLCPASTAELQEMLRRAVLEMDGPVAVRYPRGCDGAFIGVCERELVQEGTDITVVTYGTMFNHVSAAGALLREKGIRAEIIKLSSIKPIHMDIIRNSVKKTGHLLVAEEVPAIGSVGAEIVSTLTLEGLPLRAGLVNLGDQFVTHGSMQTLYHAYGLDAEAICAAAEEVMSDEKDGAVG